MTAETYYLSKNVSKTVKALSRLSGWEAEVAALLLSNGEDKAEKIRQKLPVSSSSSNMAETLRTVLEILPKTIQNRARIFLKHFLPLVRVVDGGIVELPPDGRVVGTLIDIVRFFCSSSQLKIAPPPGYSDLVSFFAERKGMPQSAFGHGRLGASISASPRKWIRP